MNKSNTLALDLRAMNLVAVTNDGATAPVNWSHHARRPIASAIANDAPQDSAALASEKDELRRRLPGVLAATLDYILALRHPAPVQSDPKTGEPVVHGVREIIAGTSARRAASADVMNALAKELPAATYDARFSIARNRVPELFA